MGWWLLFFGKALIFAKVETETETLGPAGQGAGWSASHRPPSRLCWCAVGSLPCQSSCCICLSACASTHQQRRTAGTSTPAALSVCRGTRRWRKVWSCCELGSVRGRGQRSLLFWWWGGVCWNVGPDSLTWRHGNSCSTLPATPAPVWRRGGGRWKEAQFLPKTYLYICDMKICDCEMWCEIISLICFFLCLRLSLSIIYLTHQLAEL